MAWLDHHVLVLLVQIDDNIKDLLGEENYGGSIEKNDDDSVLM